jgi:hypothetical protein
MSNMGRIYAAMTKARWFSLTTFLPNILIMTAKCGRHSFQRSGRSPATTADRAQIDCPTHSLAREGARDASVFLRPRGSDVVAFERRPAQVRYHDRRYLVGLMGVGVPVSGMFVSAGAQTGGIVCKCATAGASRAGAINPPAAEGEIRLGIESSMG